MSGPKAKTQRRREERAAAEAEAARAAATRGRLQLALGGLVAVVALVAAIVVFSSGSDASSDTVKAPAGVTLPAQKVTDLKIAAKGAGCTLGASPSEGREHTTKKVVYKTNPPTSGAHNPQWSQDGIYAPGETPPLGKLVHTLEHGRVDIQYRPGTPRAMIDKLETLGAEKLSFGRAGYHTLVFQNSTGMRPAVAATAWTQSLTCPRMTDGVYDAVRAFRVAYTDKGPELIP